jgi:hypothetical protein
MSRPWKYRPSPAMVVALLALFVSMGGTGYAVTKLPKRSVGPAQLRKNAVRGQHIKAGSITAAKLAKSTLASLRSPVAAPTLAPAAVAAASPATSSQPGDRVAYADKAGLADRALLADRATAADGAAAADTAAVADRAKQADNASALGGKAASEFLASDVLRWIPPFTIGEGTREMLKVGPFTLTARCTIDETVGGIPGQDQADIIISTTQAKSAFDGDDLLGSLDPNDNIENRQFVNTVPRPHGDPGFEASSDGLAIGADGVLYVKGSYLFAGMNIAGQADKCRYGGYIFL